MQKLIDGKPDRIPAAALLLGLAGLIPFIALPVLTVFGPVTWLPVAVQAHVSVPALSLYAAVILSFMGGVQWGLAVAHPDAGPVTSLRRYGVSVLPALIAWFALLTPTRTALMVTASGFVLLLIYDLWTVRRGEAPAWYERLRILLTSVVVPVLTLTVIFVL